MHSLHGYSTAWRLLAVCLVLAFSMAACGLPVGDITETPAPDQPGAQTATVPLATQPAATQPAATQSIPTTNPPVEKTATSALPPAPETGEILIYMVALEDAGKSGPAIGCGDSLIPVRRTIEPTTNPIADALAILFSSKTQYYGESGLYNALYQSNLSVERAEVDANGNSTVSLVGQYQLGGACDTPRFKSQIEQTILSIGGVKSATILLNSVPIDQALSTR